MKKMSKMLVILTLLAMVVSLPAFAANDVEDPIADWKFGDKGGTWGFVYQLDHDDDGFVDQGALTPYYNINHQKGPRNITARGAYIRDGQDVNTVLGVRLGVDYSPYIANFDGFNRIVGVRVGKFVYEFGPVKLNLDGTYAFTHVVPGRDAKEGKPNTIFGPRKNDILLGADIDVEDVLGLKVAMSRYSVDNNDPDEGPFDYYYNVAAEAKTEVIPGLNLTGVYAYYNQYKDWLYEVTAKYQVIPGVLSVRAGHRNSVFEAVAGKTYDKLAVVGGANANNKEERYIGNLDPLKNLYNRDNSINVGANYKFTYDVLEAVLDVEYDTTNPAKRGDFDDVITVSLDAKALGFKLFQKLGVIIPDDETDDDVRHSDIHDPTANRMDYEVDFATPKYSLDVPFADEVFAIGRVNFDWDKNYVEKSRYQTIASVELGAQGDVWRLDDFYFGAILAYDLPSDDSMIKDPFKYALIAKYQAPNRIAFRLEYQNSVDYADSSKWIHNKNLNDRYDEIRFYDNSKFGGIRFAVAFPL